MYRTLERLDAAASTIVPILYLIGLAVGTAAYFTGLTLGLSVDAGLAVGVALAAAAEMHAFLQQRRCRALYGRWRRTDDEGERVALGRQFRDASVILAGLMAFSTYNAISFAAATWHPTSSFLPAGVQIAIRGLVIPILFFLAGFLAPLHADASALLSSASHDMLHRTIRATLKQWKKRVDRARKSGTDLAPVAIALMLDSGNTDGARRIQLIADGLRAAEHSALPAPEFPTGPGSPTAHLPRTTLEEEWEEVHEQPLHVMPSRRTAADRRTIRKRARRAGLRAAAFDALDNDPQMSRKALREVLNCAQVTANELYSEWRERNEQQEERIAQ